MVDSGVTTERTRTYVVTGSASGIGAATRALLGSGGHRVVGVDLADADVRADLGTPQGRRSAVAEVLAQTDGVIDAVICCAGVSAAQGRTVSINYFGVVDLLVPLREALARGSAPRAAVVSSVSVAHGTHAELEAALLADDETAARAIGDGLEAQGFAQGYLNYPSSKGALSRWVRREAVTAQWAGAGIALNAVAPGTVLTPMTAPLLADPQMAELVDAAVPMPYGGHQSPESVAELLVWLTSPANTALTGQTIYVDGGAEAALRPDRGI